MLRQQVLNITTPVSQQKDVSSVYPLLAIQSRKAIIVFQNDLHGYCSNVLTP